MASKNITKQAIFNGTQSGNLPNITFTRNINTKKPDNTAVTANTPRYGKDTLFTESPSWNLEQVTGNSTFYAAGYDSAGTTPIAIIHHGATQDFDVYQNGDLQNPVRTIELVRSDDGQLDLLAEQPNIKPHTRYLPSAAVCVFGMFVFLCERYVDLNSNPASRNYESQGVTILVSQDMCQTFQFVVDTNGTEDIPGVTGANGLARLREWAMSSAFPETAEVGQDWLSTLISFCDYINDAGTKPGGQAFLFRATRTAVGQPWTIEPIRKTYEISGTTNMHFHSACAFRTGNTIYQYVTIGDSIGQNGIKEIKITDAVNYTTSSLSTRSVNGSQTFVGDTKRFGNQGLAPVPGPDNNSWIMGGDDDGSPLVLVHRPVDDTSDVIIDRIHGNFSSELREYNTFFVHCGDLKNRTDYVARMARSPSYTEADDQLAGRILYSPNGLNWATIRRYQNDSGSALVFGDKILHTRDNGEGSGLLSAPKPEYVIANPLLVSSGAQNYVTNSSPTFVEVSAGSSFTTIARDGNGDVVHPDTSVAFTEQPPAFGPVVRCEQLVSATAIKLGRIRLDATNIVPQGWAKLRVWVRSLNSGNHVPVRMRLNGNVSSSTFGTFVAGDIRCDGWTCLTLSDDLTAIAAPYKPDIEIQSNGTDPNIDIDFLMVFDCWLSGANPYPYPIPVNGNGPNELATLDISELKSNDKTISVVARIPENSWDSNIPSASLSTASPAVTPLFTAFQDSDNYVTVYADITNKTIRADVVSGGSSVGTPNIAAWFARQDQIKINLRINNDVVSFDAIIGGAELASAALSVANTISPVSVLFASNFNQTIVGAVEFYSVKVSDNIGEYETFSDIINPVTSIIATPGDTQIGLSWTAPVDTDVDDYLIQYKKETESTWTTKSHGSTSVTSTITGLVNNVKYNIRIAPVTFNAVGQFEFVSSMPIGSDTEIFEEIKTVIQPIEDNINPTNHIISLTENFYGKTIRFFVYKNSKKTQLINDSGATTYQLVIANKNSTSTILKTINLSRVSSGIYDWAIASGNLALTPSADYRIQLKISGGTSAFKTWANSPYAIQLNLGDEFGV